MKTNMLYYIILSLIFMTASCKKVFEPGGHDQLSLNKNEFSGTQLKTNGYYYQSDDNGSLHTIYFFYRNGTLLYGGGGLDEDELALREMEYSNGDYYDQIKNIMTYWGVFQVNDMNFQFEKWYSGEPPMKAYVRAGTIINDTTFQITESYRMLDGQKTEVKEINELYHFRAFSPKPDSTNSFIE